MAMNELPQNIGQTFGDIGDIFGLGSARREREFNAEQAEIQRNWEQQMSNTAYQRAVKDMEAAGLNPAMMFSSGANPASTPSGASANATSARANTFGISQLVNSAANLSKSFNNDKNTANDMNKNDMINTIKNLSKLLN